MSQPLAEACPWLFLDEDPELNALFVNEDIKAAFDKSWGSRKLLALLRLVDAIPAPLVPVIEDSRWLSFIPLTTALALSRREEIMQDHFVLEMGNAPVSMLDGSEGQEIWVRILSLSDDESQYTLLSETVVLRALTSPFFLIPSGKDNHYGRQLSEEEFNIFSPTERVSYVWWMIVEESDFKGA